MFVTGFSAATGGQRRAQGTRAAGLKSTPTSIDPL
jgi:hypothetical protein